MLAIQGQVIGKLVGQKTGQQADVGDAGFEDRCRGRCAVDRLLVLDDAAHVLEHHVAAGLLCQTVRDFFADHPARIVGEAGRIGQINGFHRHRGIEAQAAVSDGVGVALLLTARVGDGVHRRRRDRLGGHVQRRQ